MADETWIAGEGGRGLVDCVGGGGDDGRVGRSCWFFGS